MSIENTFGNERLTYIELAAKLRVTPSTIRSWQTREGLPYVPCGGKRFYSLAVVEQWLRERDDAKQAEKRMRRLTKKLTGETERQAANGIADNHTQQ